MREHNENEAGAQARSASAQAKEFNRRKAKGWGHRASSVYAEVRGLAFTMDPGRGDGERLPRGISYTHTKQNRAGQSKDIANAVDIGKTLASAIEAAGPTQKGLLIAAIDGSLSIHRPNLTKARHNRLATLRNLRKSARTVIDHHHGVHAPSDAVKGLWLDTLVELQSEIAFWEDSGSGNWHIAEIEIHLPGYVAETDADVLRSRFLKALDSLTERFNRACVDAANLNVPITLPKGISGAAIGARHGITLAQTRHIFPGGKHGIKAVDSTFTPARRRTVDEKVSHAAYVRTMEDVAKHFGKTMRTVQRWARGDGEKFRAMRDQMIAETFVATDPATVMRLRRERALARLSDKQHVTDVTPGTGECREMLIEDNKQNATPIGEGVTSGDDADLFDPNVLKAVAEWRGVKPSSLRAYRSQRLPYLRDLVDRFYAAMANEIADDPADDTIPLAA